MSTCNKVNDGKEASLVSRLSMVFASEFLGSTGTSRVFCQSVWRLYGTDLVFGLRSPQTRESTKLDSYHGMLRSANQQSSLHLASNETFQVITMVGFRRFTHALLLSFAIRVAYGWIYPFVQNIPTNKQSILLNQVRSLKQSSHRTPSTRLQAQNKPAVAYQKVVRPPPNTPSGIFLGYLIEFIQNDFEIPKRLPMVYERRLPSGDDSWIMQLDSPLSPNPQATRLTIDSIGIIENAGETPSMAMVVVRKDALVDTATKSLPPMLQNLFADSERKILQALDRALEQDFVTKKAPTKQKQQTYQQAQESMWTEVCESEENNFATEPPVNVIDAEMVADPKRQAAFETMQQPADIPQKINLQDLIEDFAVQAARRAANHKEDFAVAAAKKAAKKTKNETKRQSSDQQVSTEASYESSGPKLSPTEELVANYQSIRPPNLDPENAGPRTIMQTISKPTDYAKKRENNVNKSTDNELLSSETKEMVSEETVNDKAKQWKVNKRVSSENVSTVDDEFSKMENASIDESMLGTEEREMYKATKEAMEEIAASGKEMTPEEMLYDVMKFGEKEGGHDAEAGGFVSGAFEKAKEILREQKTKRDMRLRNSVVEKVSTEVRGFVPDIKDLGESEERLSPEEELRRMFEAGEKLADGRITVASQGDELRVGQDGTTEDDIEQLIRSEKSISSYGRILDDELVELEVRINKSPDEELDGRRKNPIFDVFSGPETYNPNVDPEKAVNWPGALPGTKQLRLPKELDEAVKQARFAAEVLSRIQESNDTESDREAVKVGNRDLSPEQIESMQALVREAVDIGIIEDPLEVMAERSRLQLLLDELWNQPQERYRDIIDNYRDLLLSDNFVRLIKHRLNEMADKDLEALRRNDDSLENHHKRERELLGQLVVNAQLLLKEARALGAELEAQQLEVIRSICKVAMDPSHQSEEETARALTDAVRDIRPLFDDAFVAYLKYAIAEEEGKLARAGVLDDPEHNEWLVVLKIIQQGVYSELSRGINRHIDHIFYVLRMDTPTERRMLLKKLIDAMPTMDVRPFVKVVDNIVGALGDSVRGEFDSFVPLGEMTYKLLQLRRDVNELLPPDRIAIMSRDADEWAARQKKRLLEARNVTRQRIQAARDTEHLQDEIDSMDRRGEIERMD